MRYRNIATIACLIFIFSTLQSCYTLRQAGTPTQHGMEITNSQNLPTASHFSRTKTVHHFVGGLVSPDDAGIEEMIGEAVQLAGGTKAVNVRIKYQMTFLNGLVNILTVGIYTPFTLTVEGDVVR